MSDKEQYRQKMQAHLDEWKAELEKLKNKASRVDAETRMKMKNDIADLEKKLQAGRAKLAELEKAGGEAWESARDALAFNFSSSAFHSSRWACIFCRYNSLSLIVSSLFVMMWANVSPIFFLSACSDFWYAYVILPYYILI